MSRTATSTFTSSARSRDTKRSKNSATLIGSSANDDTRPSLKVIDSACATKSKVIVSDHTGVDAHVTLVGPNGDRDNLNFQNQPAARMIYFEATGNGGHADVWAEIVFAPGEAEHKTKLHIRLYANVKGLASLVVSDKDVRTQREQKIERQLSHVRGYFARTAKR